MRSYTGWQYLLIDAANQYGLDKLLFEERIKWATENLSELESMEPPTKTKPLYLKAVQAIREAQAGLPIGHVVGLDSVCSGIQLMSVLTGCVAGATATGLVDPDVRADAYGTVTDAMNNILGTNLNVAREDVKQATMTAMYGSKLEPKKLFGEDTPELSAFHKAIMQVAPGAWELLQTLLIAWQPDALAHSWKLPDGFDSKVKVMVKHSARIEVDELDHSTFTYEYYVNESKPKGRSLAANAIHSVDGYIVRSLQRRCNYNRSQIEKVAMIFEIELLERLLGVSIYDKWCGSEKLDYYIEQYKRSGMVDITIAPWITISNVRALSDELLSKLTSMVNEMLSYKPFELVCIHDAFEAHVNNLNYLRQQYINIMAELADSNLLDDLLSQIHNMPGTFKKLSSNLGTSIRGSNYGLS